MVQNLRGNLQEDREMELVFLRINKGKLFRRDYGRKISL